CFAAGSVDADDVLSLRALRLLDDVELDPVALGEGPEAGALDRRVVDEAVLRSVLRGDEAEALLVVEPLHGSGGTHTVLLMGVDDSSVRYARTISVIAGTA